MYPTNPSPTGGSAPEAEVNYQLSQWAKTLTGMESYCVRAFAEALEVVPYTLAENAGLNPIQIVTELRNLHANGEKYAGLNVKKVRQPIINENISNEYYCLTVTNILIRCCMLQQWN